MTKSFQFKGIYSLNGWLTENTIYLNQKGEISKICSEPINAALHEQVNGYAIPGFQNAHSHAFQYAMAGLAEIHPKSLQQDDFWSWRDTMYKIALQISPVELERIATLLYAEMLRHGYTSVAEFHYIHHNKDGSHYSNVSEMGERLIAAAKKVGIAITLVPIFYKNGGFGLIANDGQKRFISNNYKYYLELLQASSSSCKHYDRAQLGIGIHSLRAVDKENIEKALFAAAGMPIHIHIAEQLKEIDDCQAYYGKRPVEWLNDNFNLDENWHLVHATHLTSSELQTIASSKANVVLCPSTEGNLGDGIFQLINYQKLAGNWSIGTDSHISIDPKEELRLLDYGQRLISHNRSIYKPTKTHQNAAEAAIDMCFENGSKAMGNNSKTFEIGNPFDAVVIDANYPLIAASGLDKILSTYLYAGDSSANLGTITNGKWQVYKNQHIMQSEINNNFINALNILKIRI